MPTVGGGSGDIPPLVRSGAVCAWLVDLLAGRVRLSNSILCCLDSLDRRNRHGEGGGECCMLAVDRPCRYSTDVSDIATDDNNVQIPLYISITLTRLSLRRWRSL